MDFNYHKLKQIDGLELGTVFVQGGTFSHRHPRDVHDAEQCRLRQIYLDHVPNGDYLIILDSDEALFGALGAIPFLLSLMEENDTDYTMISEFLPDGTMLLRPRILKKREGLKYGGPLMKHDYISLYGRNYIDVENEARSYTADFLGFFHYKNGNAIELYSDKDLNLPKNIVKIDRIPNGNTLAWGQKVILGE